MIWLAAINILAFTTVAGALLTSPTHSMHGNAAFVVFILLAASGLAMAIHVLTNA